MKIFFEGDLQTRSDYNPDYNKESVHYLSRKAYIEWVLSNPKLNAEDVVYFSLGDLTETSIPMPRDTDLLTYYFSKLRNKKKYILAGNHDFNRAKRSYSFQFLDNLEGVETILKPQELEIGGSSFMCLPYYYDNFYEDLKPMREEYEAMEGSYDFVVTHIQDHTQKFSEDDESIDTRKLKGERIQGHIHLPSPGYPGSPVPNKSSEVAEARFVWLVDTETKEIEKIMIPTFLDYAVIDYPKEITIKPKEGTYVNFMINNYEGDRFSVLEKYRKEWGDNFFVYKMVRKSVQENSDHERMQKIETTKELWDRYVKTKRVKSDISKIVSGLL